MSAATKMPSSHIDIIDDPDLNAAVKRMLAPLSGRVLERAQAAVREVHGSGIVGTFTDLSTAYRAAIQKAAGSSDRE